MLAVSLWFSCASLNAGEPVTAATDIDALFHSSDPKLDANKKVVYYILKDMIQSGHWELAPKYMTDRYIQHNPGVPTGRDNAVKFFLEVVKIKPVPIEPNLKMPIVSVIAEGDYVAVAVKREVADSKDPTKKYTTAFFDMWRFKDGKADEHWDAATPDSQVLERPAF
jgi:predicted SnoaL-like aldol condensation-catalyzing enzyme